ncbi:hypothetical protein FKM82_021867 [Ascaphus truei]
MGYIITVTRGNMGGTVLQTLRPWTPHSWGRPGYPVPSSPPRRGEIMVPWDRQGLDHQRDPLTPPRPRGGHRHSIREPGCCVASAGAVRVTPLVWNIRSGPRDAGSEV